jgi:hypothetical protein
MQPNGARIPVVQEISHGGAPPRSPAFCLEVRSGSFNSALFYQNCTPQRPLLLRTQEPPDVSSLSLLVGPTRRNAILKICSFWQYALIPARQAGPAAYNRKKVTARRLKLKMNTVAVSTHQPDFLTHISKLSSAPSGCMI